MVNYTCPRCGYEINIKQKYINHLRRKTLCNPIVSDNNLHNEYIKYDIIEKINLNESSVNVKKMSKNVKKIDENVKEMSKILCEYCDREFNTRQSKWYHLKVCKEKKKDEETKESMTKLVNLLNKQNDDLKEQIKEQNNQINELIKKAGVTIGSIGTQNIQQNIKILAYNNTDVSHLTDKDYLKCLNHSNFCIPHLIEKIHFNPKKPENHNIYISNLKNNYVMIYNGNKWMLNNRDESIENLILEKESMIVQKLEEWIENGNKYPEIMKKFNRYIEKKENDKVIDKVKEEIKLMLFNNRDVISSIN
jgi:DNA-directed RNA polymerase subunit RPC12/RpoP